MGDQIDFRALGENLGVTRKWRPGSEVPAIDGDCSGYTRRSPCFEVPTGVLC